MLGSNWFIRSLSRLALGVIVVIALAMAFSESLRPAAAPLSSGLVASVDGVYDVRPDDGAAHVEWNVLVQNTGPLPLPEGENPFAQPAEIEVFVPHGFTDFRATTANGTPMGVTYEDVGYGSVATLHIGYPLTYGDSLGFTYAYTLNSSSESGTIISPSYVFIYAEHGMRLPALYEGSHLRLTLPNEHATNASFEYASCTAERGAGTTVFSCPGNEFFGAFADLEVIDEDARIVVSEEIEIEGRSVDLILRYWEGDEAWADRARATLNEALPVYADVYGAAYDGPGTIRISEKGGSELYGAAGLAACQNTICALAVSPAWDDQTLLHEISHMWSAPFDNNWLIEGTAEYTSLKAAAALGLPGYEQFGNPDAAPEATMRHWNRPEGEIGASGPGFALDHWGGFFGATAGDEFIDPQAAYAWSARFFQELEREHGPEPFRKVMEAVQYRVADGSVDSETFMDLLEDTGGVKADELFKSYVFPQDKHIVLTERREIRDRFEAFQTTIAEETPELETAPLAPIRDAILDWRFDVAGAELSGLEISYTTYMVIRDDLEKLRADAGAAGLAFPSPWDESTRTWMFEPEVIDDLDAAYDAIDAYTDAQATVDEPRGLFQKIGLLGKDDRAALNDAAGHFAWARFDESIESSAEAELRIERAHDDGVLYTVVVSIVAGAMLIFVAGVYVLSRRQEQDPANVEPQV